VFGDKPSASTSASARRMVEDKLLQEVDRVHGDVPIDVLGTEQFARYRLSQLHALLQRQRLDNHVFRARMINNTRKLRKEWQPKPTRSQHQQRHIQ
jgi:hypothetical protein